MNKRAFFQKMYERRTSMSVTETEINADGDISQQLNAAIISQGTAEDIR